MKFLSSYRVPKNRNMWPCIYISFCIGPGMETDGAGIYTAHVTDIDRISFLTAVLQVQVLDLRGGTVDDRSRDRGRTSLPRPGPRRLRLAKSPPRRHERLRWILATRQAGAQGTAPICCCSRLSRNTKRKAPRAPATIGHCSCSGPAAALPAQDFSSYSSTSTHVRVGAACTSERTWQREPVRCAVLRLVALK